MKALILGAGYALRLRPLTTNNAKPLLLVGGRPMIDYVVQKVDEIDQIDRIFVVINDKFYEDFQTWAANAPTSKPLVLVNDGSTSAENRLGATADINFVVEKERIHDDLLVVGGDNLFDFQLPQFVTFFEKHGTSVGLYPCSDLSAAKRFNTIDLDDNRRITFFEEKPANPRSDVIAICLYLFSGSSLGLLKRYLDEGGNHDAPGYYIQWLHRQIPVFGKVMDGTWYDIGDKETYAEANKLFDKKP
jgi:glucose-1-phosphate thymidylyltransferase